MIFFKKYWHVLILIFAISAVSWPLFLPGYFSHQDDLQIMRIFEMRKCLTDFQIPCRWVPDMGYGNGYPLFNYYSAFPYYLGAFLSFVLGYIWAVKTLFFFSIILSGISMYLLCKEFFGKTSAVCSSILYLFAPYRALDLYVRGALVESIALSLMPLLLYFSFELIKKRILLNFLGLVLTLGIFLTSHNIMTMLFLPILIIWCLYWLIISNRKNWKILILAIILGFGISAFFILPAYFEKSLVQSDSLISMDLNFRAHFVSLEQLFFDRNWGYGTSNVADGQISLQIGWPYWWLAAISIVGTLTLIIFKRFSKIFNKDKIFILLFSFCIFCFSIFMTHIRSSFIWEKIQILSYVQFPWRFLSLAIFSSSILGGLLISLFRKKWQYLLLLIVTIITLFFNWNYFKPKYFYFTATDEQKLTGLEWERQQKAAIVDYLPMTALEPREEAPAGPVVYSGISQIHDFINFSNRWQFQANVINNSTIEVPVFDFPGWQVKVDGIDYPHSHKNIMGRIQIDLSPGKYTVSGQLYDTPIRKTANIITLISFIVLGIFVYYGESHKVFI